MSHLVARSGEQAVEDLKAQIEGAATLANWDPLMAAHWAIANRVMERVGLAALNEGFCPCCAVDESYKVFVAAGNAPPPGQKAMDANGWINSCTDSMLNYARDNGLMPGVQ